MEGESSQWPLFALAHKAPLSVRLEDQADQRSPHPGLTSLAPRPSPFAPRPSSPSPLTPRPSPLFPPSGLESPALAVFAVEELVG